MGITNDLIYGIKYRIPLCCILYFVKKSFIYPNNTAYEIDKLRGNVFIMKETDHGYIPLHPDTSYVECDKCFNSSRSPKLV